MIRLMLVAGDSTEPLYDYLRERGSLEINYYYDSIYRSANIIKNSIVKVDKLIYIYQDSSINIKQDMQVLKELLSENSFFSTKEIIFFIKESEFTKAGISYFKSVMQDTNYENYSIQKSKDTLSFANIYEVLLGVSTSNKVDNMYNNIYRVERGESSANSYEPQDTSSVVIEPFSYKSVINYENVKNVSIKSDKGIMLSDDAIKPIQTIEDSLDTVKPKEIVKGLDTIIVSGNPKSGSSTFAINLALSSKEAGKKVLMVDLNDNSSLEYIKTFNSLNISSYTLKDLMVSSEIKSETSITLMAYASSVKRELRLDFLRYIVDNLYKFKYDLIIVDCSKYDLYSVKDLLHDRISSVFLTTENVQNELVQIKNMLYRLTGSWKIYVVLSELLNYQPNYKRLSAVESKELLSTEVTVVKPLKLEDFDMDDTLFNVLLEGLLYGRG